ncbi:MAG: polynucleotide kinase-phosphatase [Ardenticatenales bacterium]
MRVTIPDLALVVLVGPSGSGKSTFARRHFKATEIISSDACRGVVSDDESDQTATKDAFDLVHTIARLRLARGRLTVIDATSVRPEDRRSLVALARSCDVLSVAIVLDLPPDTCHHRNAARPDRAFGPRVVERQSAALRRGLRGLKREGFQHITVLHSPQEVDDVVVDRQPLWTDRRTEPGPFDIIGDVHGCYDELVALLSALGYAVDGPPDAPRVTPPAGRTAIFLGDLVDRGPNPVGVLKLVMAMVADGAALCVPGNHDDKLKRALNGRDVQRLHGLAETLAQLDTEPPAFKSAVAAFIDGLISHYVLDDGKLVVAHAGMPEAYQGRASARVREFALYGGTTGEVDADGLPVRIDWAADYRGEAMVVYGHTARSEPVWRNRTICIDTGCAYGGTLTALRYPELTLVQAPSRAMYSSPARPLAPPAALPSSASNPSSSSSPSRATSPSTASTASHQEAAARPDDLLDITDVLGKRFIDTRTFGKVTIREANAAAALEVMSRFAIDPRWLIYLPPTMSPAATSAEDAFLEHPSETFAYFRSERVARVVCQEKHMGSRAILVVCRDRAAARRRFGAGDGPADDAAGVVYTRTGRPFFPDRAVEAAVLDRVRAAAETAGWWDRFATDWLCLDAEIMPWSAKAAGLIETQFATTGAAGGAGLAAAAAALRLTAARADMADAEAERVAALGADIAARRVCVEGFVAAYGRYCWDVAGVADLKIAPFHLLATEGHVHTDHDHAWHMAVLAELRAAGDALLHATAHRVVDLADDAQIADAERWWIEATDGGGEGMVVKPLDWLARGRRRLVQPALKCRGREYLRLVYGPEYTLPANLSRLRVRSVAAKRSLALREYALGLESLHRFVEGEPLYRVHECAFGVLALESEPVDPRL